MGETNRIGVSLDDLIMSQCIACAHKDSNAVTCTAFPDGIPEAILRNRFDHRQEHEGDRGIRYLSDVEWDYEEI